MNIKILMGISSYFLSTLPQINIVNLLAAEPNQPGGVSFLPPLFVPTFAI